MIEAWYKTENGEVFEVVAIDDDGIGIQYLDGMLEELDSDDWDSLSPREVSPPREALAQDYEHGGDEYETYDFEEEEAEHDTDWRYGSDD